MSECQHGDNLQFCRLTLDFRIRHAEQAKPTRLRFGAGASPTLPASEVLFVVDPSSSWPAGGTSDAAMGHEDKIDIRK
jgi:hypothetical protein